MEALDFFRVKRRQQLVNETLSDFESQQFREPSFKTTRDWSGPSSNAKAPKPRKLKQKN
jgi:hypothetical protein